MSEALVAPIICGLLLGGQSEVPHAYQVGYDLHRVSIDCQTETHVIEIGLDKRSSMDSVHQALFASYITGLKPGVVIVDTDGREDQFEFQIKSAARAAGVEYRVYSKNYLIRWQMTQYLRSYDAVPKGGS